MIDPQDLLGCIEAMSDDQLSALVATLAKAEGLRELRALYAREAQAVAVRGRTAEGLLECVAGMTTLQRARLCELLDPAETEADFVPIPDKPWDIAMRIPSRPDGTYDIPPRIPVRMVGPEGLVADGDRLAFDDATMQLEGNPIGILVQRCSIEGASRRRAAGIAGFDVDRPIVRLGRLIGPRAVLDAFRDQLGDVRRAAASNLLLRFRDGSGLRITHCVIAASPAREAEAQDMVIIEELTLIGSRATSCAADTPGAAAAVDTADRDRWMRARARWEQLFGEAQIPLVRRKDALGSDLDLVEAMLYDKETRGVDPPRCPCGCGFVRGCGGASLANDTRVILP
jgi:hypothetical protein